MRGLIKRWARQYLYTGGGKPGERSKQYPAARSVQGNQPGAAGARMSAEESNEIFAVALEGVTHSRFAPLLVWHRAPISESGEAANGMLSAAHVWSLGETWACGDQADVVRISSSGDGLIVFNDDQEFEWKISGGSATPPIFTYCPNNLVDTPRIKAFGRSDASSSGAVKMITWDTLQNLGAAIETDLVIGSSLSGPLFAGFDAGEAFAILGVKMTTGVVRMYRSAANSTTISAATTATLPSTSVGGGRYFAHGNGMSLVLYSRGTEASEIVCAVSTDGGDTWDLRDEPPWGSTAPPIVSFVDFVEDFLGFGPRFVALVQENASDMRIVHSADGTDWQSLTIPDEIIGIIPTNSGATGVFLGDTLIFSPNGVTGRNSRIYVLDLRLLRAFAVKPSLARIIRIVWDGCRLWAVTGATDGGFGQVYYSGPLVEPANMYGGRLTDD